jgi:beta-N-acetylhexosaminidase
MSLEYDVVPVAKHFPGGLGEIAADPHKQLPVYEAEYDWQTEKGLRLAIATGVPAVMVTHILYPQYDDWPASASEYFVREVLREKMKFAGLVIVDDLSMGAVAEVADVGEYATASIEAGGELLLFSVQDDYLEAYAEINRRVEIDPEFAEMVGERVYHVLRWKEEYLRE